MENQVSIFQSKSKNAFFALYMFFLRKHGFRVIDESKGGNMRGGNGLLDEIVSSIFLAVILLITFTIVTGRNPKELNNTLDEAAVNPGIVVNDMFMNHTNAVMRAVDIVENFQVDDVYEINNTTIEKIMNPIFNKQFNNKQDFVNSIIRVGANAVQNIKDNHQDFGFGDIYSSPEVGTGQVLVKQKTVGKIREGLKKYIKKYTEDATKSRSLKTNPFRNTDNTEDNVGISSHDFHEDPSISSEENSETQKVVERQENNKPTSSFSQRYLDALKKNKGGSKSRRQNRKKVDSKRKRGGSKKQKRRSNKRR
jgi:hypothetical protein